MTEVQGGQDLQKRDMEVPGVHLEEDLHIAGLPPVPRGSPLRDRIGILHGVLHEGLRPGGRLTDIDPLLTVHLVLGDIPLQDVHQDDLQDDPRDVHLDALLTVMMECLRTLWR